MDYPKKRLIFTNTQDSDPSKRIENNHDEIWKITRLLAKVVFLFILITSVYLMHAGIFSVSGLLKPKSVVAKEQISESHLNSQNLNVLQGATHTDPNPIKGGGEIVLVDDVALMAQVGVSGEAPVLSGNKSNHISVYEVRPGDTLSQIADMFNVSMNTIRWANDFEGAIQPGQKLTILPVTGVQYKVKSGGSIADVAGKYVEGSENIASLAREVALFNGLEIDAELKAGDTIILPNVDITPAEPKKESPKKSSGSKSSGAKSSGVAVGTKANVATTAGWLVHPVPGGVKTQSIHGYNGIDIGAPIGTPIRASAAGTVIVAKSAGWNGGYGQYVVIKHDNGVQTLYAHASAIFVTVGEYVAQGAQIANVGSSGNSTGPHTHYEVRGASNPF